MAVVVVTDSSSCIDPHLVEKYDIRVVPLHIIAGGLDLREGVDDLPDDLSGVTTSGPSPAELTEAYSLALDDSNGDGVVAVHLSRLLSGTWDAAAHAARAVGDRVRLVDSRNTAMGLGFAVLEAVKAARAGADLQQVYDRAVRVAASARTLLVVDRLDHLRRGGRIGTATALLGTALAMKPVLHLVDGKLVLREKTRTMSKAMSKLVDGVVAEAVNTSLVAVHHRGAEDRAQILVDQLTDRLPAGTEVTVSELDAVLGAHVGPGAVGVVVASAEDDPADTSGH